MDKYKIISNLGDGTYGIVYKAQNCQTGEFVAIKKIKRKYQNWEECMSLREVRSLRKTNHINLVKLKEIFQIKEELNLVFEYLDQNLYQMYMSYKEKKQFIPIQTIKNIIFQIASGLDSLHKSGYFHRDLKPENILINNKQNSVKICDFGLAREVRCRPPFTEYVSTRWYRAPEVLLHSQNYNSPIDIFSLGCIMAELYNLNPLFSGASELDQFYKIINLMGTPKNWPEGFKLAMMQGINIPKRDSLPLQQLIPRLSAEANQLLSDMLQYDPQKRPTAAQILKYPYFQDAMYNQQNIMEDKNPFQQHKDEYLKTQLKSYGNQNNNLELKKKILFETQNIAPNYHYTTNYADSYQNIDKLPSQNQILSLTMDKNSVQQQYNFLADSNQQNFNKYNQNQIAKESRIANLFNPLNAYQNNYQDELLKSSKKNKNSFILNQNKQRQRDQQILQ